MDEGIDEGGDLALSWFEVEIIIIKEIKLILVFLLIMLLIMLMILVQDVLISGGSSSQWWFKCFTHSHCRLTRTHFQVKLCKNSTIEETEKRHAKR